MALLEDSKDHFLLGVFGPNCSSGMSVTKIPERWDNSWENNVKLARMLEDAGFDFMLPVARWIGYGGETNFQSNVLESFTWAAGLVALTKRIKLVVTAHTTVNHPVAAAKQIATIDQIGKSRVALNIVAGWNKPEYEALGLDLPATHEERYGFAQEWCQIVRALWTRTEPFDWDGRFWKLKNVMSQPRPAHSLLSSTLLDLAKVETLRLAMLICSSPSSSILRRLRQRSLSSRRRLLKLGAKLECCKLRPDPEPCQIVA